jgi:peptidoglycan-associated lipoprotein
MVATPWPPFQRVLTRCFFVRTQKRNGGIAAHPDTRRLTQLAAPLLVAAIMNATPVRAQKADGFPPLQSASVITGAGVEAYPRYHIPRSSSHSIYFLPGSADLDDSAQMSVAVAAKRLIANSALRVSLVAYGDDLEDGIYGADLRTKRAAAVVDAFDASGISRHRISTTASRDPRQTSASCTSEYCRQSYRRVGLVFTGAAGK